MLDLKTNIYYKHNWVIDLQLQLGMLPSLSSLNLSESVAGCSSGCADISSSYKLHNYQPRPASTWFWYKFWHGRACIDWRPLWIGCNLKQTDFIAATLQQDRMGGKFVPGWQWRCSVVWFFIVVFTTDTRFSKSLANWSWKEGYPDRQTQRATCKVAITWVWGWQLLSWPFRRDAFKKKGDIGTFSP